MTQYDSPSTLVSSSVDGALFGNLSGVQIDNQGYVTAQFYERFESKDLQTARGDIHQPRRSERGFGQCLHGQPGIRVGRRLGEATTGGAGSIQANALEGSTVDLANEFTNLITTQRAYSASARIMTTASKCSMNLLQMSH